MNSILTPITGVFGKRMLLASLLPVLLTFLLVSILYVDVSLATIGERITALSAGNTTLMLLGIIIAAFTLHTLNVPILRLFEGYPWRDTLLGRYWVERHAKRFTGASVRSRALRRAQGVFPEGSDVRQTVTGIRNATLRDLQGYPYDDEWILPTRLGNVMRRAETYSYKQYGIDSVYLWPRLLVVIDDRYNAMIEESRISMDFCIHMAMLLALAAMVSVASFFVQTGPLTYGAMGGSLLLLGLAWLMYLLSIGRAHAWGQMIKSSIDLFRWDLLERLGIQYKPGTMQEERELWLQISRQLHHGDFVDTDLKPHPRVQYRKASVELPAARAKTGGDCLTVNKTFINRRRDSLGVKLTVTNNARTGVASFVQIIDEVLAGYAFAWNSERGVPKDGVKVREGGRIEFSINAPIPAGNSFTVEYRMIRLHS